MLTLIDRQRPNTFRSSGARNLLEGLNAINMSLLRSGDAGILLDKFKYILLFEFNLKLAEER
jgi:hypothetical protein